MTTYLSERGVVVWTESETGVQDEEECQVERITLDLKETRPARMLVCLRSNRYRSSHGCCDLGDAWVVGRECWACVVLCYTTGKREKGKK
jgi:hypothetical protein